MIKLGIFLIIFGLLNLVALFYFRRDYKIKNQSNGMRYFDMNLSGLTVVVVCLSVGIYLLIKSCS